MELRFLQVGVLKVMVSSGQRRVLSIQRGLRSTLQPKARQGSWKDFTIQLSENLSLQAS